MVVFSNPQGSASLDGLNMDVLAPKVVLIHSDWPGLSNNHKLVCCVTWHGITISFHANLPHRFDPNESNDLHWSLICVYNAKNNPCEVPPPSQISPRGEVEDDCVKEIGKKDNVTPYNQHKSKARRNQRSMPGPHPAEW